MRRRTGDTKMSSSKIAIIALMFASLSASTALAGPVKDFETDLRAAYGQYRISLFATNAAKPDEAAKSLAAFKTAWSGIAGRPVPPHYSDDARYAEVLKTVATIADKANAEIAAGKLAEAHETLEAIRDEIGGLHARNGIIGFSDRMNAYHARMEHLLGLAPELDAAGLPAIAGDLAVLGYLADDVVANPPADADASFTALVGDVQKSLVTARAAVATGDVAAAKTALGGLKAPYAKLFLKFG